jgi:hypothetical protein
MLPSALKQVLEELRGTISGGGDADVVRRFTLIAGSSYIDITFVSLAESS